MSEAQRAKVNACKAKFLRSCTPLVIKPLMPMHAAILRLQASR